MMNNTNTEINANAALNSEWKRTDHYAYLSGCLEGLLRYWVGSGTTPGVNITDRKVYDAWVEQAIKEAKASAEKHSVL